MLDPKIKVTCTAVRVPVFIGHSESVNIEFENEITADRGPRHPARSAGLPGHRQARERRLHHPVRIAPVKMPPTSRASARTRPSKTASTCGSFPTTCARVPPSTPSRSPSFSSVAWPDQGEEAGCLIRKFFGTGNVFRHFGEMLATDRFERQRLNKKSSVVPFEKECGTSLCKKATVTFFHG